MKASNQLMPDINATGDIALTSTKGKPGTMLWSLLRIQ